MRRDHRASVVRILNRDSKTAGSGFFCLPKGYVVTCYHVLDVPANSDQLVRLAFLHDEENDPIWLTAKVCWDWSSPTNRHDIAVLELIEPVPLSATPLALSSNSPRIGEIVNAYGFPVQNPIYGLPGSAEFMGLTKEFTSGLDVYVFRGDSIAQGYSGSPCILRETNEVVGIVSSLTSSDLAGRWPQGSFVTPAQCLRDVFPIATVGAPPAAADLIGPWKRNWEPFQKYIGSPDFASTEGGYEFPRLTKISDLLPEPVDALLSLTDEFNATDKKIVVIVGAPGTGKSKLLAELARHISSSGTQIPILVTARSYVAARGNTPQEHISESLRSDGEFSSKRGWTPESLESLMDGSFRCILLIDGADEVTQPADRSRLFARIAADSSLLIPDGHSVVVATRPIYDVDGYEFKRIRTIYRLESLDSDKRERSVERTLGSRAKVFLETATSAGLISNLDTPLMLNLAMTLFERSPLDFPRTTLEIYSRFVELLTEEWEQVPASVSTIKDLVGSIALSSLFPAPVDGHIEEWLTEIDSALNACFLTTQLKQYGNGSSALPNAQAALNFSLASSGLLYKSSESINWAHLLLRDYLAALRMADIARGNEASIQQKLNSKYADSIKRESLILFICLISPDEAERMLCCTRDSLGGFPVEYALFIKDCILKGAIFNSSFLVQYFSAFENHAVADQKNFGGCEALFSGSYSVFWHLLIMQRIPEAGAAIERAVSRADPQSIMCEWPHSDRALLFAPRSIYEGPLAKVPGILGQDRYLS